MIRVQYFANFVGDVAVIFKKLHGTPNFICLWGRIDFKQPLKFKV